MENPDFVIIKTKHTNHKISIAEWSIKSFEERFELISEDWQTEFYLDGNYVPTSEALELIGQINLVATHKKWLKAKARMEGEGHNGKRPTDSSGGREQDLWRDFYSDLLS